MSKITQKNKELKGKQKKIAESKESKKALENTEKPRKSSILNIDKCCTCSYYPQHIHGEAQPCKIKKAYVARKCAACSSYKCKFN